MTATPLDYQSAAPRLPHSRAGIASVVVGVLCVLGLFLSLTSRPGAGAATSPGPSVAVARLIGLAGVTFPMLGVALGIVGVLSKQRKRVTAALGLCVNGLVLLLLATAVVLFLAMR